MPRLRSATIQCLLAAGVLGLGCDASPEAPASPAPASPAPAGGNTVPASPATPAVPETPASAPPGASDPSGLELVSFVVEPLQRLTPVAVTAELTLTRDAEEHARVVLKAACRIDGTTYVETDENLLIGNFGKQGTKTDFDVRFFGYRKYRVGDPLGDCDFWLSSRVVIPDTGGQFRERLLATRCLRGGEVLEQGCAAMPTVTAPRPLTESSVSVAIIHAEVVPEQGTERGHLLDFTVELTGNEAVAPRWDLEAEVVCQGGGKTTRRRGALLGVDIQELGPGEKGRNGFGRYAKPEETLDVPPEQCELAITGARLNDDRVVQLGTWCYTPQASIRTGSCPTGA